jgi:hypothetical protein
MVVENTGNGCRSDLSYLVFERMAELSGCSIIIGHKENLETPYLFFLRRSLLCDCLKFSIFNSLRPLPREMTLSISPGFPRRFFTP